MRFRIVDVIVLSFVIYVMWSIFGRISESFHSGMNIQANSAGYWWSSIPNYNQSSKRWLPTGYPYYDAPHPYTGNADPSDDVPGDMTLANMYRKWHNIEGVNRVEVLEHQHVQNAGGDDGVNRQRYIAEALDREAMKMQKLIRDDIAANRIPWSDAYADNVPRTALGGSYNDCAGAYDCQYDQDMEGDILGIPSVPGTIHSYY